MDKPLESTEENPWLLYESITNIQREETKPEVMVTQRLVFQVSIRKMGHLRKPTQAWEYYERKEAGATAGIGRRPTPPCPSSVTVGNAAYVSDGGWQVGAIST